MVPPSPGPTPDGLPQPEGWAIELDGLTYLIELVSRVRPSHVVEFGSGVSTVWLANYLDGSGARLVSIEHSDHFAQETTRMLDERGLTCAVDLRVAPLEELHLGGDRFVWYDTSVLADLRDVDLVLVDGPPGTTCPLARYPAVPVMRDRLTAHALVVLDDADREEERRSVARWLAEACELELEPGTPERFAILRKGVSAASCT